MHHAFKGIHLMAELYGVSPDVLRRDDIASVLHESIAKAGMHCLRSEICGFSNGGYTLFFVLMESHVAAHTYIEHGAVFLDIFTCGETDPAPILSDLIAYYAPERVVSQMIERGQKQACAT